MIFFFLRWGFPVAPSVLELTVDQTGLFPRRSAGLRLRGLKACATTLGRTRFLKIILKRLRIPARMLMCHSVRVEVKGQLSSSSTLFLHWATRASLMAEPQEFFYCFSMKNISSRSKLLGAGRFSCSSLSSLPPTVLFLPDFAQVIPLITLDRCFTSSPAPLQTSCLGQTRGSGATPAGRHW